MDDLVGLTEYILHQSTGSCLFLTLSLVALFLFSFFFFFSWGRGRGQEEKMERCVVLSCLTDYTTTVLFAPSVGLEVLR